MVRSLLVVAFLASTCQAAHPYDSVGRIGPPGKSIDCGGSCVLVAKRGDEGLVVTSGHVCPRASTFEIYWPAVGETQAAKTVAVLKSPDLAFLVVHNPPVEAARVGLRDGNVVFTGFPAYDRANLHWQSGRVIYETHKELCWENSLVPGMSGGAVFDRVDGDLCGINRARMDEYSFGVPDWTLMTNVIKYKKKAWTPDDSHVAKKLKYGISRPWKGDVVTNKYDPAKAPKLEQTEK